MAYDNIEISQLMTERYVEDTGLIRSDSFNRLYDLKLRSDLIYNDTGVKNTPNDTIDSHVFEVIANDFGIEFMTYEDVALGNVITPFIPINNNRNVSNVSTITIGQYDSVDLTDSLLIVHNIIGTSTNPVKGSGGTISRGNANLLKLNTQYVMVVHNLSSSINNINIKLSWCEEA